MSILLKNKLKNDINFKIFPFKQKIKRTLPHKQGYYYELILINKGLVFIILKIRDIKLLFKFIFFNLINCIVGSLQKSQMALNFCLI